MDQATLATIASFIGAVGPAMLVFRIQREADEEKTARQEGVKPILWFPTADRLILGATLICLLAVILPLLSFPDIDPLSVAATGSAAVLVAGYPFAILAHYRIIFKRNWIFWGDERTGPRREFEPPEVITSLAVAALAVLFFVWNMRHGTALSAAHHP